MVPKNIVNNAVGTNPQSLYRELFIFLIFQLLSRVTDDPTFSVFEFAGDQLDGDDCCVNEIGSKKEQG